MRTTARNAAPGGTARVAQAGGLDGFLLRAIASRIGPAPIRLRMGDATVAAKDAPPVATVRFHDRATLLGAALDPERGFGDAYAGGRIEVEGDLLAALVATYRTLPPPSGVPRLGSWRTIAPLSPGRNRRNVRSHYDLGNDFYATWLDEQMVYTCAYFESPDQTLEEAQVAKMEHVCKKVGLRPGETVIEAGCGWGALALHMARRHGVRVRAYNVSAKQIAWARARAEREGLDDRVEFIEEDYRRIDGRCDVFVSVGMLEHVGRRRYGDLARVIASTLDPERGRGILHFIGRDRPQPLDRWIGKRVFPGAYAPTLDEACRGVLVPAGASVHDVENLRPHYALTLRHWRERYERALEEGKIGFDAFFRRMWRLYLAGSEAAFITGTLQLFQVVFAPAGSGGAPWTRRALYRTGDGLAWNEPTS